MSFALERVLQSPSQVREFTAMLSGPRQLITYSAESASMLLKSSGIFSSGVRSIVLQEFV